MSEEIKIFGIEWYDVKTKFKKIIRSIGYSHVVQEIICTMIFFYMQLVYYTSRKTFINDEHIIEILEQKKPMIMCIWHRNLMMMPFVIKKARKTNPDFNSMALASKHGDGQFVARVMAKFGLVNIHGSSQNRRKASRGIDVNNFRKLFHGLNDGLSLAITPDGPRGPKCKINSNVSGIAKFSGVPLLPSACLVSHHITLNTWDGFRIPLPFSKIIYAFDDFIWVNDCVSDEDMKKVDLSLEEKINAAEKIALEAIKNA